MFVALVSGFLKLTGDVIATTNTLSLMVITLWLFLTLCSEIFCSPCVCT